MEQNQLFERPPFQRHSLPSIQAAGSVAGQARNLRERVYRFIVSRGRYGATDDEIQHDLNMNPSTQRPRRVELAKEGRILSAGETRKTRSGRKAVVWKAA